MHATRAFTILGMLAGLAAGTLFGLRYFVMKEKPILSKFAAVVAAVAGKLTHALIPYFVTYAHH